MTDPHLKIKIIATLSALITLTASPAYSDEGSSCEDVFSIDIQVKKLKNCNQNRTFVRKGSADQKSISLLEAMKNHNNVGASVVKFRNKKKIVYRSANLAEAPLCLQDVVRDGKVKTIIDLHSGTVGFEAEVRNLEASVFTRLGGETYIFINDYMVDSPNYSASQMNTRIASIIKLIASSDGNVLIHCLTGEHDTGVIFGVIQKCYNGIPIEQISKNLACHMAHMNSSHYAISTYEIANNLIKNFSCDLLE